MVFRLGADGRYDQPATYTSEESVPVGVLPELEIDLSTVFME